MDPKFLRGIKFFAGLADSDLEAFARHCQPHPFKRGDEVLPQGRRQPDPSLYIVREGLLHVRRQVKEHDVLLGRLEPGSAFGEVSLFDRGPTTARVVALTDGALVAMPRSALDRFTEAHPAAANHIYVAILEEMAERLRRTDERLGDTIVWGMLLR